MMARRRLQMMLQVALPTIASVAMSVWLPGCSRSHSPTADPTAGANGSAAAAQAPVIQPATPRHKNSMEVMAGCQPELGDNRLSVPNFEVDAERYNRVAVQMKVRFLVNGDGFVMNEYVSGATVVTPADQEAGLDYVRHLTFQVPDIEECQTLKIQMVGNFHLSKQAGDEWTTVFDAHPVYSFQGDKLVVNPN
jgi:hypothetical protein